MRGILICNNSYFVNIELRQNYTSELFGDALFADEMGLGKTVSMIGLIAHHRPVHMRVIPDYQC